MPKFSDKITGSNNSGSKFSQEFLKLNLAYPSFKISKAYYFDIQKSPRNFKKIQAVNLKNVESLIAAQRTLISRNPRSLPHNL